MRARSSGEAHRDLGTLFRLGVAGALSDSQLLERFLSQRDDSAEEAFAVLVRRHGPMVFGVCRRILGNVDEAEDAYQATFLVLALKAGRITRRESLANWLYGVALRTAKDARARAKRRDSLQQRLFALRVLHPPGEGPVEDLRAVLDEELDRLPTRLRVPLLLCELESMPRQDAAHRLGIPEGTLSSRLARGKAILRERLVRRGVGLSVSVLATELSREARAFVVPHTLVETTIRAATLVAAGRSDVRTGDSRGPFLD